MSCNTVRAPFGISWFGAVLSRQVPLVSPIPVRSGTRGYQSALLPAAVCIFSVPIPHVWGGRVSQCPPCSLCTAPVRLAQVRQPARRVPTCPSWRGAPAGGRRRTDPAGTESSRGVRYGLVWYPV